jgi:pyruvate kinase
MAPAPSSVPPIAPSQGPATENVHAHTPAPAIEPRQAPAVGLADRIGDLISAALEEATRRRGDIDAVLPQHRQSAVNLAHYLGLRKLDVRHLQGELTSLALSSLGRCEGHVMDTLLRLASWLTGEPFQATPGLLDATRAEAILHRNTRALFGPKPAHRHVYIMATAPDESEATESWANGILEAGVDLLRINGAHQTPAEWRNIVSTLRARAQIHERSFKVFVDLPGPKLRTELRSRQPALLHLPRHKDARGRTVEPTRIELVDEYRDGAQLPIPLAWVHGLRTGDRIRFVDAGGRLRELVVRETGTAGIWAECGRSLYLTAGLELTWRRRGRIKARGITGEFPARLTELFFAAGDRFLLNADGRLVDTMSAGIVCAEPALLAKVQAGERVILDDGRIAAVVESLTPGGLQCRVTHTLKSPTRLRSGKGIAFPDSALSLPTIGPEDHAALEFALQAADGVEVSFVNSAQDVRLVADKLRAAGKPGFAMVLKLETRQCIENLPEILLQALQYDPVGLMIARGDLAVELSFERLAEVQEELLWFGEACHVPVIWATQVLDTLAHAGVPTRAEVTDAAMSMRAECVMLNKGPYAAEAVQMLADIIGKMEGHQYKKRSMYRPLHLALGRTPRSP